MLPSATQSEALAPPSATLAATAVRLRGVSKIYGSFAALRNVSTEFSPGSSTVILGDNGAGKSTLLRIIAGLIAPTLGQVEVFGLSPQTSRGRIAYMSHEPMLYDELSAVENLQYFGALHLKRGISCACAANPEMALRAVGLNPKMTRPVGQYSQGMRQRASLARVLQSDSELLLLDEPFSNLDVDSARQMVGLLLDFRTWPVATGGLRTILLTTHQARLAEPLADATLTLRGGAVLSVTAATRQ